MKYLVKNTLIGLLLLFIWKQPVLSQQITFNKIIPEDGGNFAAITAITQDKNGFIWFSTKRGFYKYDGRQLTPFVIDPLNPNSPASNDILAIIVDDKGDVWTGSLGLGLDRYQPESGIFTHFQHDSNNPGSLSNDTIPSVLQDHEGKIWIATHQGLNQYDPATNKFIHFKSVKNDSTTLSSNQVRVLYEDKEGTLWIGTGSVWPGDGGGPDDGGLNRYNREDGTFTRYKHNPNDDTSLISNKISSIYEDNNGVLWIGTGINGLHKMNRQKGTFERIMFDPLNPEKLSGPEFTEDSPSQECITFMTQDIAGNYWFGTYESGLFYFNPEVGKIIKYQGADGNSNGFTGLGARSAFTSRDGILWIGGSQDGSLYRIDPLEKKLPNHIISGAPVNCFYEETDGIFWIGTENDLIRIDRNNGDTIRYNREINPLKATINNINVIKRDLQGTLWIGSNNGLHYWDESNNKFISYLYNPKNKFSISNNRVLEFLEDSKNNFWIATFNGLNLLDRETGKFTTYYVNPADTTSIRSNIITFVFEDKYGKLWAAVWNGGGINLFDRETKTFKNYLKGLGGMYIYEDSDGILWIGTGQGFYKYNRDTDNFIRYDDTYSIRGMPFVSNIVEDNQKYLWLGTNEGIVRINPKRDVTSLFGEDNGVTWNSLRWQSVYKGLDGVIYFGNFTGYYKINPLEMFRNTNPPEVIITGFSLSDQNINPDNNGPLKEKIQDAKKIELRHDQNTFSFDFAVIDYINPRHNRLIYNLENYDQTWLRGNLYERAYYFNVPPGKYIFHVKGSNSNGVWAEKKIDVIILPPWYRTSLAYGFYALLLIASVFGFDRIMRRRIVLAEREKSQKRELAQAREIEKAYTELKTTQSQLIQSEKMASLGELTAGIAHEIQNPLNFVNNFSEVNSELIDELSEEADKGNLDVIKAIARDIKENEQKINHHGKRADAIVKGMLQHSRTSSGQKEPTDINALADEYLRLAYHGLRAKDNNFNADFKTEFDPNLPKINVIPQDIGRVLLNLINNAFYAVNEKAKLNIEGYKPEVTVRTTSWNPPSGGRGASISVTDNGPGIPDSIKDKIFQPFFTTKPTGSGTGLGLSLSYDIVKAHGGELKVETKEGEGTEFIIQLPIRI
jgi:signal transduction histidine kinase/ligand-binding sensor domain-containing protein